MRSKWFKISLPYSIAKMNMSMCALGHAEEFKNEIAGKFLFNQEQAIRVKRFYHQ